MWWFSNTQLALKTAVDVTYVYLEPIETQILHLALNSATIVGVLTPKFEAANRSEAEAVVVVVVVVWAK